MSRLYRPKNDDDDVDDSVFAVCPDGGVPGEDLTEETEDDEE